MDEFLKSEFDKLKNERVISEEVFSKIMDYYNQNEVYSLGTFDKEDNSANSEAPVCNVDNSANSEAPVCNVDNSASSEAAVSKVDNASNSEVPVSNANSASSSKNKTNKIKKMNLQMILSIISSCLIAGGIISLIAYNWNAISRLAKSITAFFICMASPVVYQVLTYIRKKPFEQKSKEFFSVLWTLLFGGSIAFISQIYRMASNPVAFLIIWIFISIGIMYSMKSYFTYFFSLILLIIYSIYSQQYECGIAVAFYPAMFLLYFFAKKDKRLFYFWLVELISLVGVVFEKCLPGLWIITYVSLDVLLINYAKKENDIVLKIFGYIQTAVLAILLAIPYFWEKIGFGYYRANARYNIYGSFFDYIVTAGVFLLSFGLLLSSIIKNVKTNSKKNCVSKVIQLVFLLTVFVSYICGSLINGFAIYITRVFLVLYFTLFMLFFCFSKSKQRFLFILPVIYVVILGRINFVFILLLSFFAVLNLIFQNEDFEISAELKKLNLPSVLVFVFALVIKIVYSQTDSFICLENAMSECKTVDLILVSVLLLGMLTATFIKGLKIKSLTMKTAVSQGCFYLTIILLGITNIIFEYSPSYVDLILNLVFMEIALFSCADFIINKSKGSCIGICTFLINYFVIVGADINFVSLFALLFLILFALNYYVGTFFIEDENYKYLHSLLHLLLVCVTYFVYFNEIPTKVSFNPCSSTMGTVLVVFMLLILFAVPLTEIIKGKKIINFSSLVIAIDSIVFLLMGIKGDVSTDLFISSICILNILAAGVDVVFLNKKENIIILVSSLIVFFGENSRNENYYNAVLIISLVIFAIYYYSKYFTEDKTSLRITETILYSILFFVAIILDKNDSFDNQKALLIFSSVSGILGTVVAVASLIGVPVYLMIKNKDISSISSVLISAVSLLFFLLSGYVSVFNSSNYLLVVCSLLVVAGFIDTFVLHQKSKFFLFIVALLYCETSLYFPIGELNFALSVFALLIYSYLLLKNNSVISKLVTGAFSFLYLWFLSIDYFYSENEVFMGNDIYLMCIIFAFLFCIPSIICVLKRIRINYANFAFCLLTIINFLVKCSVIKVDESVYLKVRGILVLVLIIAFSIIGVFMAYEKSSLKSANYYLIFLCLCFIIRFFMISKDLVERGLVCIVCGICILVMNMIFSKKIEKSESKQKVQ